jgi:hypothetical protein
MPNQVKKAFLGDLESRYGKVKKLSSSLSLYDIGDGLTRLYIRYSRLHNRNQGFYGLRKEDIQLLDGRNSVVCFLWDNQKEPLFLTYSDFEDVFSAVQPASDGQYKVQVFLQKDGCEFYVAQAGRFNVERFFGWTTLDQSIDKNRLVELPDFSHSQIQTLLGSIGSVKGYEIWIPPIDRNKLDWKIANQFACKEDFPSKHSGVGGMVREVDVIWMQRGAGNLKAMFEVEHSTAIYSALLRFNDFYLTTPDAPPRFNIVASDMRRSLFLRQVNRPTFKSSGLAEICNFLEYRDVYGWFNRTIRR